MSETRTDRVEIIMLESKPGSDDGMHVQNYKGGETYEVGRSLADNFVKQQSVAEYIDPAEAPALAAVRGDGTASTEGGQEKGVEGAPDNKDAGGPPSNKEKGPAIPTTPEERIAAITTAIRLLDEKNPEQWTKADGAPQVYAIENVLGYGITAPERNEAWGRVLESLDE